MASPRREVLLAASLLFGLAGWACEDPAAVPVELPGYPVLAIVAGDTIRAADLADFETGLAPAHRSRRGGLEAHREHLESLVDIRLMVAEAVARGLDRAPSVAADLEAARRQTIVEEYVEEALGRIEVSEPELIEVFESSPYSMSVLAAHIVLPTRESAEQTYAEIRSGRSFEALARERSLDRATAEQGGAFDRYYTYDEVSAPVRERIFDKEIGAVIQPFRTVSGYEIGKVLDRRRVDFDRYRSVVERVAVLTRFKEKRERHIEVLVDSLELQAREQGLRRLAELFEPGRQDYDLDPSDAGLVVYAYTGGEVTLSQSLALLTGLGATSTEMTQIDRRLRAGALPDLLLLAAAEGAGYGDAEDVRRRVAREQHKRLLKELWALEIDPAEALEDEAESHYRAHPERYTAPAQTMVREILVATEAEAEDLSRQIRGGASMGDLAAAVSLRLHSDRHQGVYYMRPFERVVYGRELMAAAAQAAIGELQGPVRVERPLRSVIKSGAALEEAYSIFRVLERRGERLRDFEDPEAQRLAYFYAGQEKRRRRLRELVSDLRRSAGAALAIDESALLRYAQTAMAPAQ